MLYSHHTTHTIRFTEENRGLELVVQKDGSTLVRGTGSPDNIESLLTSNTI